MSQLKKKRFRFSERERIKCLNALFDLLCETEFTKEEDVWKKLHAVVSEDERERFQNCSFKLLKDHMLEQVIKFRKFDADEATESGKERIQTEWGDAVRKLLTVWSQYEDVAQIDIENKKNERGKKRCSGQKFDEVMPAKAIRQAALQSLDNPIESCNSEEILETEATDVDNEIFFHTVDDFNDTDIDGERGGREGFNQESSRVYTAAARKTRNGTKDGTSFSYLIEKMKRESQLQQEQLRFKEKQHQDNMKIQIEELEFKKAKLEFEQKKWQEEEEGRKIERQKNAILNRFLENILTQNLNNKNLT
ncbi:hypothetical protein Zmor_011223 [Zophobas morio]|uniref:Uncharacterized protein n=1 Tax=Zophobas morio TaxID=2755281 RepID=A0AA38IR85_9CUCU|nr:hypothetical protein Zmor_011223 [Zophobas morio]